MRPIFTAIHLINAGIQTHFILFPGVICPKYASWSRIATYSALGSSGLSVALPKYNLPAALATVSVNAVDVAVGNPLLPVAVTETEETELVDYVREKKL